MRERLKPTLALMALAPLLTEFLTGNYSIASLVTNPLGFLLFVTVGYGFPILLLREFAVRRGVGLLGMLPLGVAYGIVNEGFFAKTFFLSRNVPVPSFDGYGFYGGVELPWAITISTWHALFAFLFPILITETLFPESRARPWLSRKGAFTLILLTSAAALLGYFGYQPGRPLGDFVHFCQMWIVFMALIALAWFAPASPRIADLGRGSAKAWQGVAIFTVTLVVPFVFAGMKVPVPMFLGYFFAIYGFGWVLLSPRREVSHRSLTLAALGAYLAQACFGILIGISQSSVVLVATEVVFITLFAAGIIWLSKPKLTPAETV